MIYSLAPFQFVCFVLGMAALEVQNNFKVIHTIQDKSICTSKNLQFNRVEESQLLSPVMKVFQTAVWSWCSCCDHHHHV